MEWIRAIDYIISLGLCLSLSLKGVVGDKLMKGSGSKGHISKHNQREVMFSSKFTITLDSLTGITVSVKLAAHFLTVHEEVMRWRLRISRRIPEGTTGAAGCDGQPVHVSAVSSM